jgi:hypothetical protein
VARRDDALVAAYRRFAKRTIRERETFRLALDGQYTLDHYTPLVNRSGAWYCLIRLHDAWADFCRSVLLLSAYGGVRTRQGVLIAPSPVLQPGDDALKVLEKSWKQNKQMCRWQKQGPPVDLPVVAIVAAQLLSISNLTSFSAGIGASNTNAPVELKACRNFLAHRHEDTALHHDIGDLRLRINAPASVTDVGELPAQFVSGGVTLFEEWCLDLETIASAAIS